MNRDGMIRIIEDYIRKKAYTNKDKKLLRNLLIDKETGFLAQWESKETDGDIGLAIKKTVTGDPGGKTELLQRMKRFSEYLTEQGIKHEVDWPPIDDIGNRYERLIFILREMQTYQRTNGVTGENAVAYLSELLWVSDRTILDDFSFLLPPEDRSVPRTIFQQSMAINGMKRSKGAVQFASTAHPVFLVENLTSVLVMIESLLEKAKDLLYQEQAMTSARRIWKQLTSYAQERLTFLLHEFYPEKAEELSLFSRMLEGINAEDSAFVEERTDHMSPMGSLLNAMKMGIPCRVQYRKNGWELSEWSGVVKGRHFHGNSLEIPEADLNISCDDIIMVIQMNDHGSDDNVG